MTLKPHAGLLARGKGLEQGKVGIRRRCRPYPPSGRGLFLPAWQGGSDDLGVSLSTWVHVLTRESSTSNPSYLDADVSTRGPADTCDVFARVSTCCLHMNSLQPFPRLPVLKFPILNLVVPRNVFRCLTGKVSRYKSPNCGVSVRPLQGRQVAERIAHVVLDVGPAGHEARELL